MNTRIKLIADAATFLFLRQGYARTQISHIAKAIGVSVGTIYLDFSGKKEILNFVLKCTVDPSFMNREFVRPITDDLFVGIENELIDLLKQNGEDFEKHLEDYAEDYRFESLISDAFDLLSRYAVGCLFIEKNQYEFASLAEHYKVYRKKFFEAMTKYIRIFIDNKTIRKLKHIELSTTLIIEILTWWAMDRRFISFEATDISLELAKEVCMDNIISAYKG